MGPHVTYIPTWNFRERPLASNASLGMAIFLIAETMFFSGLISAYLVLRSGFGVWPPSGQPRLPWEATACSTLLLLLSGAALFWARHLAGLGQRALMKRAVRSALALGSGFLLIQGYEWLRMIGYGLRLNSGIYAGTFYLLIGCHAVHVAAGLGYLLYVGRSLGPDETTPSLRARLTPALMYWTFVVALWPVLYGLVYF